MSPPNDHQQPLRLLVAPKASTVDMLFRMFGTVLIPLEQVRAALFRNLNADRFGRVVATPRLPLPVTTLEDSTKAQRFIEIHHLAAHIEQRASQADDTLAKALGSEQEN